MFGKPIVFGPHMENFAEIARTFLDNGAAIQVRDARELEPALLGLLGDPVRRASLGAAARALVEANRGARGKSLAVLAELLPPRTVRRRAALPGRALSRHAKCRMRMTCRWAARRRASRCSCDVVVLDGVTQRLPFDA